MKRSCFLIKLVAVASVISSCNSNNLGDNIYVLEGDRKEDRIIVECTGKSFGDCIAGDYLIPRTYAEHFDNGEYSEFVDSAKANGDFIIASTVSVKSGTKSYWIIDKKKKRLDRRNGGALPFVLGPLDPKAFSRERKKRNIGLNF
jgi:hypothetical protein